MGGRGQNASVRRVRVVAALLVLAAATAAVVTARLFVWPPSASPEDADAVVLFSGGRGERLERATSLMEDGVAPVLVISNGLDSKWPQANRLCRGEPGYEVRCPSPEPDNTRGEARMTARLAEAEGWDDLVLVTSTYHATRAGTLLRRCHDGDVDVVAAPARLGPIRTVVYAARELVGTVRAQVTDRGC